MTYIDESYGLSGPPFDDEEESKPRPSWDDEMADKQDWHDNRMEDRRIEG